MTLTELMEKIYQINLANGWFDGKGRPAEAEIALLHSEVSETFEEIRKPGCRLSENYYTIDENGNMKPEGVPSELADIIIRALDTAHRWGVDIQAAVDEKLAYNITRGYRYGGKLV